MESFNLFIKTLTSYHNKCLAEDLPINVINPLLIGIDSFIGDGDLELRYEEKNIQKRLFILCNHIKKICKGIVLDKAFLMYGIVTFIDQKHEYFVRYKNDVVRASAETAGIIDQKDDDIYWLTAWHPERVANNGDLFIERVNYSKELWTKESELLSQVLYNIIFMPPFNEEKTWSIMRCEG